LADSLASLPEDQRKAILEEFTPSQINELFYDWKFWARPDQLPPSGAWRVWLILAGRGWGKTRTGAEFVIDQIRTGKSKHPILIGPTAADVRDVMVGGESGILSCSSPDFRPIYESSKRRVTWPNGISALLFSAEEPDRLRGPQSDLIWADEPASWKYPETWDMAMFGLRLGSDPRVVATTTPRPTAMIRGLVKDPLTAVTRGSTYDNQENLAPAFIEKIIRKYEGTRLGRQELNAEILDDNPGALWQRDVIEHLRVMAGEVPPLIRIVVGVDPAVSSGEEADETGIVVDGMAANGHCYVLADVSIRGSPHQWALAAVRAYHQYRADRMIGEVNNGGDLVEVNIRTVDPTVAYKAVHATRGKLIRAEPVAALYEQGRVHHVGTFPQLEDQMVEWVPGDKSPDRMDAHVWAMTELMAIPDARQQLYVIHDDTEI
jgi:phage terminase large subunit-like protein